MIKVLFVCMGNVCRSPTAEGVFRHRVEQAGLTDKIEIDSAGTDSYHVGSAPDRRSQQAARKRGYDLSRIRARRAKAKDLQSFDYILAMDHRNYDDLLALSAYEDQDKIKLFLSFAQQTTEQEVPDPYYGGAKGFEHVLDLVEQASNGLLDYLVTEHKLHVNN